MAQIGIHRLERHSTTTICLTFATTFSDDETREADDLRLQSTWGWNGRAQLGGPRQPKDHDVMCCDISGARHGDERVPAVEQWVTTWSRGIDDAAVDTDDLAWLFASRTWTSLRAWGESLLEIAAERQSSPIRPPLAMRRGGVFAALAGDEEDTVRIGRPFRLLVNPAECGIGRADLLAPVLAWVSWDHLKIHLGEYGRDPDLVEEAISPTSFDEAHMRVDVERTDEYMRHQLDPALLSETVQYFIHPIQAYLDSWGPLSEFPQERADDGQWEVVVPRAAVRRVELA